MNQDIHKQTEAVIDDAIRLCRIPAPTGYEEKRGQNVGVSLQELGWTVKVDEIGNVIAYWGNVCPSNPLIIMAHLDTVHQGIEHIQVDRSNSILVGPGIADNSLALATLLYLADSFKGQEHPLLLVATVGEENVGNLKGALQIAENCNPLEMIALEGGGIEHLITSGPGSLRCRIELKGPGGHSWEDRATPSANHAIIDLLAKLSSKQDCESWNIGKVEGGGIISARASFAAAEIEFRDYKSGKLQAANELVQNALQELPQGITGSCQELGSRPGGSISTDHPLVQTALAMRLKHGLLTDTASASTDANAGYGKGIPSICIGLSSAGLLHTTREWTNISQLSISLACLVDTIEERLSAAKSV